MYTYIRAVSWCQPEFQHEKFQLYRSVVKKKKNGADTERTVCHIQERQSCSDSFTVVAPRAALPPSRSLSRAQRCNPQELHCPRILQHLHKPTRITDKNTPQRSYTWKK